MVEHWSVMQGNVTPFFISAKNVFKITWKKGNFWRPAKHNTRGKT